MSVQTRTTRQYSAKRRSRAPFRTPIPAAVLALTACLVLTFGAVAIAQRPGPGPNIRPVVDADYRNGGQFDANVVELGRLLFFDEILSGNRNISCATCHNPLAFTGDGLSLPLGEGGLGLAKARTTGSRRAGVEARVPPNAPPLFNLGARQFDRMFHDGRVAADASQPSGFLSPAGDALPLGLDSALAAQAMFPPTSGTEMAGQADENEIGAAAAAGRLAGEDGVWDLLAGRLRDIPEYVGLFQGAFRSVRRAEHISFVHVANAIAQFEAATWRSDGSPFDRFLRGDRAALNAAQQRGMNVFYRRGSCSRCHAGQFQTDQRFHAIAMPQIGPGTGDGPDGHDDFGREKVTGSRQDRFEFRTPSLRNVELTGPWGHDGAYGSLEAIVRHYRNPGNTIRDYDRSQAYLPSRGDLDALDFVVMNDPARVAAIAAENDARPMRMSDQDIADVVAFLRALTDPAMLDLSGDVPARVPSGLSTQ